MGKAKHGCCCWYCYCFSRVHCLVSYICTVFFYALHFFHLFNFICSHFVFRFLFFFLSSSHTTYMIFAFCLFFEILCLKVFCMRALCAHSTMPKPTAKNILYEKKWNSWSTKQYMERFATKEQYDVSRFFSSPSLILIPLILSLDVCSLKN